VTTFNPFTNKINTLSKVFTTSGLWGAITFKPLPKSWLDLLASLGINLNNKYIKLKLKNYKNPIWMRYGTEDYGIFYQIFLYEEYAALKKLKDPKLIVDCGAYVGYSSIYFLNKYPHARIVAVEPDSENFKCCQKNLSFFADRVSLFRSAIWSYQIGLVVCQEDLKNSNSIQVRPCNEGEIPDIYATDINNLLKTSGFDRIDLLKMDIETAESIVFAENYQNWLDKVDNIVIELHGTKCEEVFFKALSDYDYNICKYGELTICTDIIPKVKGSTLRS
jgi:FkbM family methyltransferase